MVRKGIPSIFIFRGMDLKEITTFRVVFSEMATLTATRDAEKIPLNRIGMVFVIPQKKVLLSRN
jgi:hypothetical protein